MRRNRTPITEQRASRNTRKPTSRFPETPDRRGQFSLPVPSELTAILTVPKISNACASQPEPHGATRSDVSHRPFRGDKLVPNFLRTPGSRCNFDNGERLDRLIACPRELIHRRCCRLWPLPNKLTGCHYRNPIGTGQMSLPTPGDPQCRP